MCSDSSKIDLILTNNSKYRNRNRFKWLSSTHKYLLQIKTYTLDIIYYILYSRPTVSFIIFWDFSTFYQIFLSPQVKRWAIIIYKHCIYKLPHELPNDITAFSPLNDNPAPNPPTQNESSANTLKNINLNPPPPRCTPPHPKTRASPKYPAIYCLYHRNYKNFNKSKFIEDLINTDFSLQSEDPNENFSFLTREFLRLWKNVHP